MTVCWHDANPDWRHRDTCPGRDGALIWWGRARSGRRWFWAAHEVFASESSERHGWADTEDQAYTEARAAVVALAAGRDALANLRHGEARHQLKRVNATTRSARPPSNSADAGRVEYLYGVSSGGEDSSPSVVRFRVTKKTAKRIYYVRRHRSGEDPVIGYVDRARIEADGEVMNRGAGRWADDFLLYATPPDLSQPMPALPDVRQLRREMGDAHPDRGGTAEAFMAARARYVAAVRRNGQAVTPTG